LRVLAEERAVGVDVARAPSASGMSAADVTDPAAPRRVVATVLARYGRLDGLVNNAEWQPRPPSLRGW
jgi:NAD(P)-dependent dehydrogenase (short-subunit alcohol dehydrogenase family)